MRQANSALKAGYWISALLFMAGFVSLIIYQLMNWSGQTGSDNGPANQTAQTVWSLFLIFVWGGAIITVFLITTYIKELHSAAGDMIENLGSVISGQTQLQALITSINENILLSDDIKSIAFREKDRQVLEGAIQEDIRMERWQSAEWLIERMKTRFGNNADADYLRQEVLKARNATLQDKISDAIKTIQSLQMIHHYQEAQQREDELENLYPENESVKNIIGQTEKLRQEHKKELLKKLKSASQNNDLDQSVDILKLLDSYLTPTEAEALKESARDVFKARLHNLGIQFSLYVTEKAWDKALRVGMEIMQEYPNTRMAQEVREKMDILKQKIH